MKENFLTKEHSEYIKGIAIVLMLAHHLFGFEEWIQGTNNYVTFFIPHSFFSGVCFYFGGICISLFSFLSGYSMYVRKNYYEKYDCCIKKVIYFLSCYWFIEIIFIAIGNLVNEPLPSFGMFMKQSIGLSVGHNGTINIIFAWYVLFYIAFVLFHPLLVKLSRTSFVIDTILYGILFYGLYFVIKNQQCLSTSEETLDLWWKMMNYGYVGMLGYLVAKYRCLEKADNYMKSITCKNEYAQIIVAI